jgi:hypothetical protein
VIEACLKPVVHVFCWHFRSLGFVRLHPRVHWGLDCLAERHRDFFTFQASPSLLMGRTTPPASNLPICHIGSLGMLSSVVTHLVSASAVLLLAAELLRRAARKATFRITFGSPQRLSAGSRSLRSYDDGSISSLDSAKCWAGRMQKRVCTAS